MKQRWVSCMSKCNHMWLCWWASSSDTLLYPSIFAFPLLPLHHWPTTTHPHTNTTTCDHTCTRFIGPILLIWWTHVLQFTCFISILSNPNMCPPVAWPIMNPRTTQSGTFYSFALDEPYARFLVNHSYLTCLYLPFAPERDREPYNCPYEFPPGFRLSTYTSHCIAFASHHFTLHHTASQSHHLYLLYHTWRQSLTPRAPYNLYLDLQLHQSLLHPRHISISGGVQWWINDVEEVIEKQK